MVPGPSYTRPPGSPPMASHRFSTEANDESDVYEGAEDAAKQSLLRMASFASDTEAGGGTKAGSVCSKAPQTNFEFVREMLIETLPTLVLSTIGLTITGQMVEVVANWKAMSRVDELFILIPVLNNMKGNLEMNLSSRLGTAAYLGDLDKFASRRMIITGNVVLLQLQALLISALAGCFSFVLNWISNRIFPGSGAEASIAKRAFLQVRESMKKGRKKARPKPVPSHTESPGFSEFIFVVCTAMSAASFSAFTLGSFMCTLIVICRRYNVNPDNVAPPIASALGDLITLFLLSTISAVLLPLLGTFWPIMFSVMLFSLLGGMGYTCNLNAYVKPLMRQGWTPLVGAMLITSFSGLVLDQFVNRYEGYGLLAIVITGLPGGVGSIFVSRISTLLHAEASNHLPELHKLPDNTDTSVEYTALHTEETEADGNPSGGLSITGGAHHTAEPARLMLFGGTLFAISFPVQLLFLLSIHLLGWVELRWTFVIIFMLTFSIAVLASLSLANWLTHYLWSKGLDPDMYAMPIQSSLVDLMGQILLVTSYEVATALGSDMYAHNPR